MVAIRNHRIEAICLTMSTRWHSNSIVSPCYHDLRFHAVKKAKQGGPAKAKLAACCDSKHADIFAFSHRQMLSDGVIVSARYTLSLRKTYWVLILPSCQAFAAFEQATALLHTVPGDSNAAEDCHRLTD